MIFLIPFINWFDLFHVLKVSFNSVTSQLKSWKNDSFAYGIFLKCKSTTHCCCETIWLPLCLFWLSYQHKPIKVKFYPQMEVIAKRLKSNLVHLGRREEEEEKLLLYHPFHLYTHTHTHIYFFFFSFIFISWRLITLQYCSGFCHTLTWISHGVTCIPHPYPPSHRPLHPIPLGLPSVPGLSTCLMHPTWAGDLFHPR